MLGFFNYLQFCLNSLLGTVLKTNLFHKSLHLVFLMNLLARFLSSSTNKPLLKPHVGLLWKPQRFVLDPKLTLKNHIAIVCVKLAKVIYRLRRLETEVTDGCISFISLQFDVPLSPDLRYGFELWGHTDGCDDIFKL